MEMHDTIYVYTIPAGSSRANWGFWDATKIEDRPSTEYSPTAILKAKDAEIAELNTLCDTYQEQRDYELSLNIKALKRIDELETYIEVRGFDKI